MFDFLTWLESGVVFSSARSRSTQELAHRLLANRQQPAFISSSKPIFHRGIFRSIYPLSRLFSQCDLIATAAIVGFWGAESCDLG